MTRRCTHFDQRRIPPQDLLHHALRPPLRCRVGLPHRIGRAPQLHIPQIFRVRDLILLAVPHELGKNADDRPLRHDLVAVSIVTPDQVRAVVIHGDHPVQDIALPPAVQRHIVLLEPPLRRPDHDQVPVLVQHRIHADPLGLIDQLPVLLKDLFKCAHVDRSSMSAEPAGSRPGSTFLIHIQYFNTNQCLLTVAFMRRAPNTTCQNTDRISLLAKPINLCNNYLIYYLFIRSSKTCI